MNTVDNYPKMLTKKLKIIAETNLDLSEATKTDLRFTSPNGDIIIVSGVVENTYNLYYITTDNDDGNGNTLLNMSGQWRYTPDIETPEFEGYLDTVYMPVRGIDE